MTTFPTTTAAAKTCRCGATVLVALDEGIPVRAEATPAPATHQGLTYVHTPRGYLTWLDPDQRPPPKGPRHAEHHCRTPTPPPEPLTLF